MRRLLALLAVVACLATVATWAIHHGRPPSEGQPKTSPSSSHQPGEAHGKEQPDPRWRDAAIRAALPSSPSFAPAPATTIGHARVHSRDVAMYAIASAHPHDPPHLHTFSLLI